MDGYSDLHTLAMKRYRRENYHGRPDWRTQGVVDAAIELRKRDGTRETARFLYSLGGRDRVIDVARTLKPGTVIANFLFELTTGKPGKIWLFDQYNGDKTKTPDVRWINCYSDEHAKRYGFADCDNGSAFFVVMVP